jgi:hypothetical protein
MLNLSSLTEQSFNGSFQLQLSERFVGTVKSECLQSSFAKGDAVRVNEGELLSFSTSLTLKGKHDWDSRKG